MKNFCRILSLVLTSALTCGLIAGCNPAADTGDNENAPYTKRESIKILAISNSYGDDSVKYLWDMLNATGRYSEIIVANLYRGGCDIDIHLDYIKKSTAGYRFWYNDSGKFSFETGKSSNWAIASEDWDVIILQNSSAKSIDANGYSNVTKLIEEVKTLATNPEVIFCWNMTWAYQTVSADFGGSQEAMLGKIFDAVQGKVLPLSDIKAVLPSGTAIQNVRTSFIGNTLNRDGSHLELGIGCYTAGLTWVRALTGYNTDNMKWTPYDQPEVAARLDVIKEAVKNAVDKPFEVTQSSFTESDGMNFTRDADILKGYGKDIADFKTAAITWNNSKKYNPARGSEPVQSTYHFCTQLYTKEELPVGSIIIIDDLYSVTPVKYKELGSADPEQDLSFYKQNLTSYKIIEITEDFWSDYNYVGFNISMYSDELTISYGKTGGIRIYTPEK